MVSMKEYCLHWNTFTVLSARGLKSAILIQTGDNLLLALARKAEQPIEIFLLKM